MVDKGEMSVGKKLSIIMALAPVACYFILLPFMKERTPIHGGTLGNIDSLGSRFFLLVPAIFMSLLPLMAAKEAKYRKVVYILAAFVYANLSPFLFAAVYYGESTYSSNNVYIGLINQITGSSINIILAVVFIVFAFMGGCADKISHNYVLGLRNRWTLKSRRTWDEVHSSSRVEFTLCALFNLLLLAVPVIPASVKLGLSFVSVLVVFTVTSYKSNKVYQRYGDDSTPVR